MKFDLNALQPICQFCFQAKEKKYYLAEAESSHFNDCCQNCLKFIKELRGLIQVRDQNRITSEIFDLERNLIWKRAGKLGCV